MVPSYSLIRGDTHNLQLVIERAGYDFASAGTTFAAEVRNSPGGQLFHTYSITPDVSAVGSAKLTLTAPSSVTAAWPVGARLMGELKLSDATLGTQRVVRWNLDVRERITS